MLKHCQNSSVRLHRRYNNNNSAGNTANGQQLDTVSLASSVATSIRSTHEKSDSTSENSSLNSSFSMQHSNAMYNLRQAIYDQNLHAAAQHSSGGNHLQPPPSHPHQSYGTRTPDPMSLSSRTSSYSSLLNNGDLNPKTAIKIYASCLRSDIDYKTLSVTATTTAKEIIWQLLSKFRMKHRDPKLFFLTMEVVIQKPGRDGLTKKTLVLDEDSRPVELKNCNPWGETKFTLQMRKGGLVKIHDSILMEESQYKCLLISDETNVEETIKLLLYCNGLEKVERPERYCMYEQCSTQRYQRKLLNDDKPLAIQALWPGPTPFSFVLRRSLARIEDNVWGNGGKMPLHNGGARPAVRVTPTQTYNMDFHNGSSGSSHNGGGYNGGSSANGGFNHPSWAEWGLADDKSFYTTVLPSQKTTLHVDGPTRGHHFSQEQVVPRLLTPESDYHTSGEENMSADSPPPPPPPPEVRFPRQSSASTSYTPRQTPLVHSRQTPASQSAPALRPRTYTSVPAVVISGDEMGAADSWGEGDKDSGEEISCSSGGEDMDTSLSSSDSSGSETSPLPPKMPLTSTPMAGAAATANKRLISGQPLNSSTPKQQQKPSMSFLYPSPDYETFPIKSVPPNRPYSAMSTGSNGGVNGTVITVTAQQPLPRPPSVNNNTKSSAKTAPSLPPKPQSLVSLFTASAAANVAENASKKSSASSLAGTPTFGHSEAHSGFHDYENYFYI